MNRAGHKFGILLVLICWVGFSTSIHAQVYSQNLVGYINLTIFTGNNLIANQLDSGDNTLNNLFNQSNGHIPAGATFTKWDPTSNQYLPVSIYDTSTGWSINYGLSFGEGGLLASPAQFTDTLVGSVWPNLLFVNGELAFIPPVISNAGTYLLSCYIPIGPAAFSDVVGRNPQNGESVTLLDAVSQSTRTTTFQNGTWSDGDPTLGIGQSAFFNLESAPEPAAWTLLGTGLLLLASSRRWQK
jgi:hypothetical protein